MSRFFDVRGNADQSRQSVARDRGGDVDWVQNIAAGLPVVPPEPPTKGIEKILKDAGIKGDELKETAQGISKLMAIMVADKAPMSAQLKMINNFVAPLMKDQPREATIGVVNQCFDQAQNDISANAPKVAAYEAPKQSTVSPPKQKM